MSESRVAPLSQQSMPRLELLSCLILSRLINIVKDSLSAIIPVQIKMCWTDSITALYWIKGTNKEWKVFVENRVQETRNLVPVTFWDHCPGKENPADIPTRWIEPSQLAKKETWWKGPKWLLEEKNKWPTLGHVEEPPPSLLDEWKCDREVTTALQ